MSRQRMVMSSSEKNLLRANVELIRKQKEMLKDINRLIAYIKGNITLESEVKTIIKYYSRVKPGTNHD